MERYKEQAQLLANYLPSGKFWEAKNIPESDLRKLLNAFGKEYVNIEETLNWLKRETNVLTCYDLLSYWEKTYGIPDDNGIFNIQNKTIEERRFNIKIKEQMDGADKTEDWERIAELFGFKCTVYPAIEVCTFPFKFPILFVDNPRYVIVVDVYNVYPPSEFNLIFPVIFGENTISLLKKVFNIIKPADCSIVYNYM